MSLSDQWSNVKSNWLIAVFPIILLLIIVFGGSNLLLGGHVEKLTDMHFAERDQSAPPPQDTGFTTEDRQRKIVTSAVLHSEVDQGKFAAADQGIKDILAQSKSLLLEERQDSTKVDEEVYHNGFYRIKVPSGNFKSVSAQLRAIGAMVSYNEKAIDEADNFNNLKATMRAEESRLRRYAKLYKDAQSMADKLSMEDRIFAQEKTVTSISETLRSSDDRENFAEIQFNLDEKRPEFSKVSFVKARELWQTLVASINSLLVFIANWLSYLLGIWLLRWLYVRFWPKHPVKTR